MEFKVSFHVNEKLYLKNPEESALGHTIVSASIDLIYNLGFEDFTFKKLATHINSTEASIYRYFENKHRLLLYILNWYWSYLEFLVTFQLQNITNLKEKLKAIIRLLTEELPDYSGSLSYNMKHLHQIVITESSKAYLVKNVAQINKEQFFKPYKDLCKVIANLISQCSPAYKFPHSFSSSLVEMAHHHQYFSLYLPRLTDVEEKSKKNETYNYLEDLLNKIMV
jgi:AcrR family transcriptional regulator